MRAFENKDVEDKFLRFPDDRRAYLFHLRALIFNAAEADARIGPLAEELRWGDPSYITKQTSAGSTVRIGLSGHANVALLFHCKTRLIEDFKIIYSDILAFSKNRAIVIDPHSPPSDDILQSCVLASLLYKINSTKKR